MTQLWVVEIQLILLAKYNTKSELRPRSCEARADPENKGNHTCPHGSLWLGGHHPPGSKMRQRSALLTNASKIPKLFFLYTHIYTQHMDQTFLVCGTHFQIVRPTRHLSESRMFGDATIRSLVLFEGSTESSDLWRVN